MGIYFSMIHIKDIEYVALCISFTNRGCIDISEFLVKGEIKILPLLGIQMV